MLEKAATMKRFEYSPLGKEIKTQTDIAKVQCQKLDDTYEFDKIIKKESPTLIKYSKSDLIYEANYNTNIIVIEKKLITFLSNQSILF